MLEIAIIVLIIYFFVKKVIRKHLGLDDCNYSSPKGTFDSMSEEERLKKENDEFFDDLVMGLYDDDY